LIDSDLQLVKGIMRGVVIRVTFPMRHPLHFILRGLCKQSLICKDLRCMNAKKQDLCAGGCRESHKLECIVCGAVIRVTFQAMPNAVPTVLIIKEHIIF